MTGPLPSGSVPRFVLAAALLTGLAQAQPWPFGGPLASRTPFPAQHTKEVKWFDSLAEGIQEASQSKKPICLVLAGQRPLGDC
jgi:hypothetical protein